MREVSLYGGSSTNLTDLQDHPLENLLVLIFVIRLSTGGL